MHKRVVITGMGCISPVGNDVSTMWENIKAGHSGVARISNYDPSDYKCQIAAEVNGFDGAETLWSSAKHAAWTASLNSPSQLLPRPWKNSQLTVNDSNRDRIGAVIGSAIGGIGTLFEQTKVFLERGHSRVSPFLVPMMLPDTGPGMVAIHTGIRGPNLAVVTACATGTNSIGEATEIIRRGQADVMFAGGAEAAIVPIAIAGLAVMTALTSNNEDPQGASRPFDLNRDGFVMGEGAAVLVLESLEHAQARGAHILAEMSGYGSTNDAYHISAPAENGAGAAICMQMALDQAGLKTTRHRLHQRARHQHAAER